MNDSANHPDGLDPLDLAAAILAELGNPTDEQIAAWNRDADAAEAAMLAELIHALDSLDAIDSITALLEQDYDIAALLEQDYDIAALFDAFESTAQREAELRAINQRRERIVRKRYGRGR